MQSTGKSRSSKSLRIGTWARPLAPPPDKTSPILGRSWEWPKAMISRREMKRRPSPPFFPILAHSEFGLAAALPIGVAVEVVEFYPHVAEVADHDEKVLGPAREVPDIVGEERLFPEAEPVKESLGPFLRTHHLGDDRSDVPGRGQEVELPDHDHAQPFSPEGTGDDQPDLALVPAPFLTAELQGPVGDDLVFVQ